MNYNCDCCNENLNNHPTNGHVCASAYGPISYRYCDKCLADGIEPYDGMVSYIACVGTKITDVNESYQMSIMKNLLFYNKSITEFEKDLEKANEEMMKYYPTPEEFEEMDKQIEESERQMGLLDEDEDEEAAEAETPDYLKGYTIMDLYSPQGTKVRYLGVNGYDCDKEHANTFLTAGEIYTVKATIVNSWCSDVVLEEFPDEEFNTVMFSMVEEEDCNDK